jgi:hypothetical protein
MIDIADIIPLLTLYLNLIIYFPNEMLWKLVVKVLLAILVGYIILKEGY